MKKSSGLILAGLCALSAHSLFSQSPSEEPVTPSQLVALALENNLGLKVNRLEVEIQEERVSAEVGRFYPVVSFEVGVDRVYRRRNAEERQSDNPFLGQPELTFDGDRRYATLTLGGRLPMGTTYEFATGSTRNANTYTRRGTTAFNPEYGSDVRFRLIQPLGRNFGLDIGLAPLNITKAERMVAEHETKGAIEAIMARVLLACYEVYFADENIAVKRESVELAKSLLSDNQKRVDQGRMSPIAVTQAEARIAEAEAELVEAEVFLQERQAVLRELTQENYSFDANNYLITDMDSVLPEPELITDPGQFARTMLTYNPDYLASLQKAEAEGYRVKLNKNQIYPEVNLILSIGSSGLEGDFGSAFEDIEHREDPDWGVGLAVNFPLNNRTAKAEWMASKKRQNQTVIQVKQTEVQLLRTLDVSKKELEAGMRRRELIQESVRLAAEALKAEETRLANGVTTNLEVLNQQRELSVSQTQALAAEVEIRKAWLQLLLLQGTLGKNLGFDIEFKK